jgi:hypothetical protein
MAPNRNRGSAGPGTPGACLVLVSLLLAASGVACHGYRVDLAEAPRVSPWEGRTDAGTVCVLRPQTFAALAQAVHTDDGRVVGVTQGARVFFCYHASPGRHRLTALTDNEPILDVVVRPGQPTFVRLELGMGPDALLEISESEARALLPDLDAVEARPTSADVEPVTDEVVPAL